jgi:hypothetical protein
MTGLADYPINFLNKKLLIENLKDNVKIIKLKNILFKQNMHH